MNSGPAHHNLPGRREGGFISNYVLHNVMGEDPTRKGALSPLPHARYCQSERGPQSTPRPPPQNGGLAKGPSHSSLNTDSVPPTGCIACKEMVLVANHAFCDIIHTGLGTNMYFRWNTTTMLLEMFVVFYQKCHEVPLQI